MLGLNERIERLLQRVVELDGCDIAVREILRSYLANDRSLTLRDIAAVRLRRLAPLLIYGGDRTDEACGWGLMVVLHSLPEPSETLGALLDWAERCVNDVAPTIAIRFRWEDYAV
jgi:hypothetical protein